MGAGIYVRKVEMTTFVVVVVFFAHLVSFVTWSWVFNSKFRSKAGLLVAKLYSMIDGPFSALEPGGEQDPSFAGDECTCILCSFV